MIGILLSALAPHFTQLVIVFDELVRNKVNTQLLSIYFHLKFFICLEQIKQLTNQVLYRRKLGLPVHQPSCFCKLSIKFTEWQTFLLSIWSTRSLVFLLLAVKIFFKKNPLRPQVWGTKIMSIKKTAKMSPNEFDANAHYYRHVPTEAGLQISSWGKKYKRQFPEVVGVFLFHH